MIDTITIRNFYDDPYRIRNWACNQEYITMHQALDEYGTTANFPGHRTKKDVGIKSDEVRQKIEMVVEPIHGKIIGWDNPWNGLAQYCTCTDKSWIHTDVPGTWAGVLYLTPNPPPGSGTGFFEHKKTGLRRRLPDVDFPNVNPSSFSDEEYHKLNYRCMSDGADFTKWIKIDETANEFNKIILYRGDYWHTSLKYFGNTIYDSRLFQTFFFTTEDTSDYLNEYYTIPQGR